MASSHKFTRFSIFTHHLFKARHDFSAHVFKIMLVSAAPDAANQIASDLIEIGAVSGYQAGGQVVNMALSNVAGAETIKGSEVIFIARGDSIGPFRYCILYNATQTSPPKPLVGWWDYGSIVTIGDGESLTVDMSSDATNVIFTVG